MGMLFKAKCPNCWDSYDICTCCTHISRCPKCFFPLNNCVCNERKKPMSFMPSSFRCQVCGKKAIHCKCDEELAHLKPLGRITPVKAYQTTDGKKFVGKGAREDAEDHQRWLDTHRTKTEESPLKGLLKKLKKKRRKRT